MKQFYINGKEINEFDFRIKMVNAMWKFLEDFDENEGTFTIGGDNFEVYPYQFSRTERDFITSAYKVLQCPDELFIQRDEDGKLFLHQDLDYADTLTPLMSEENFGFIAEGTEKSIQELYDLLGECDDENDDEEEQELHSICADCSAEDCENREEAYMGDDEDEVEEEDEDINDTCDGCPSYNDCYPNSEEPIFDSWK